MFFSGSCSEDLKDSKKSSGELAADQLKQSKSCQEKILPPNDKAYENPKLFSNSRQSEDKYEDTPHCSMWTSRNSKMHNSSNKYLMNDGVNEKFSGFPKSCESNNYDFSNDESKNICDVNSSIKTFKPNSKHPVVSNTYQKKILSTNDKYSENHVKSALNFRKYIDQNDLSMPRYSRSYSTSDSNNYHLNPKPDYQNEKSHKPNSNSLNSYSHIHNPGVKNFNSQSSNEFNSSNISPKKFDKHSSNFKKNCNFQNSPSYNIPKENNFHTSQYCNSYKSSSTKNYHKYTSDSYNIKPSYKFDQNIKMQDDVKKDSSFDENLNCRRHFEDENTELKHHRFISELDETIKNETKNNLKITVINDPDTVPDTSISSSSSISYVPISETLCVSTLSVSSTPISSASNVSPMISNVSPLFSPVSTLESISNLSLSNVFDDSSENNDGIKMLIPSDDNFIPPIPPPTSCELRSASDKLLSTAEKNVTFLQKVRMRVFK